MSFPLIMSPAQAQSLLRTYGFLADSNFLQQSAGLSLRDIFATILSKMSEGVFILDSNLRYVCANEQFLQMSQLDRDAILGRYFSYHPIASFPPHYHVLFSHMEDRLLKHEPVDEKFALNTVTGTEVFVQLQISYYHASEDCLPIYIGILTNLTKYQQIHEQLGRNLNYDNLTGLQHRDTFIEMTTFALHMASQHDPVPEHVLLRMNIDKLQAFNESVGMEITDELIKAFVQRIKDIDIPTVTLRGFSRFGGDNFGLLLSVPDIKLAHQYLDALSHAFELPFNIGDNELYICLSVGVSSYPSLANNLESLLIQAEAALKQARLSGQEDIIWYKSHILPCPLINNTHLKSAFRNALATSQIKAFFQPKVMFSRPEVPMFEALVRWEHPALGVINPQQFLDEVLETLPHELFEGIFQQCMQQLEIWHAMGHMAVICINVDGRQLRSPRFMNFIEAQFSKCSCLAQCIEFELTEISQLIGYDETVTGLNRLHEAGVRLAIDDFGTGYSSLSYLVKYPFHIIKLDKLFIQGIETDPTKQILVKAVIAMAHTLGIEVVAEGVETETVLDFLQSPEVNCDGAQGYVYGKPMSAAETTAWLDQHFNGDSPVTSQSIIQATSSV
jgi:diguanylate cyclase (GGDEF)-like protein/PAS domain S-box-containing protein